MTHIPFGGAITEKDLHPYIDVLTHGQKQTKDDAKTTANASTQQRSVNACGYTPLIPLFRTRNSEWSWDRSFCFQFVYLAESGTQQASRCIVLSLSSFSHFT